MTVMIILAMAAIVFFSRYLFLEPNLPLKLNQQTLKLLSFSGPAVLTAILTPIVFLPEGELVFSLANPYLLAALIAGAIAWKTRKVLLAVFLSSAIFVVLNTYL